MDLGTKNTVIMNKNIADIYILQIYHLVLVLVVSNWCKHIDEQLV